MMGAMWPQGIGSGAASQSMGGGRSRAQALGVPTVTSSCPATLAQTPLRPRLFIKLSQR